jgi:mitochondrial fission protein ELM1
VKRVLILTDGKAGHENQSKAFARALGCGFDVCPVRFRSRFHKALSYLFDRLGVRQKSLFETERAVERGVYAAVVGAGSGTFYAVKTLSSAVGCRSAAVLYPRGYRISDFDCVMAPSFDRPVKADNVIEIPANLVAADEAFYEKGLKEFAERHRQTKPAVAVIVGGPNKCSTMTAAWMRGELEKVFAENPGCEFWVTTSRRTPVEVERTVEEFPFDYRLIYSKDRFNPIPAFVKSARRLYVTAESTGMLSEACTFGEAEVKVLDNLNADGGKFRVFVDGLIAAGYVDGSRKIDLSAEMARARGLLGV